MKEVSLADLVRRVTEKFNPLAENKQVSMYTVLPPKLPAVRVDPNRMAGVDQSVGQRAQGHSLRVENRGVSLQEQKEIIMVSISDTEPGIPPEKLSLI